ncbi:MAG TPA: ribulose-phosphate 3-epimerase [Thermovirgaceae bacterium]|nr:ribulose-phosphate 3-epimerase [Thermovirgaceae bacterium]
MAGSLPVKGCPGRKIAPSILSADPLDIAGSIKRLEGEHDWIHLDIMDGHFVPNLSYGPSLVEACRKKWPEAVLDVHLMVEKPENFIEPFAAAGSTIITVHQEATVHLHRTLQRIVDLGCTPGVTLNPGTPVELLKPVLPLVGLVLVMSVNPGFGGQKFVSAVLEKVRLLCCWREAYGYEYLVEVDGGLGPENSALVSSAGCDVLVAGSAIFNSPDPAGVIREMRAKALEGTGCDGYSKNS